MTEKIIKSGDGWVVIRMEDGKDQKEILSSLKMTMETIIVLTVI